ncbi:hypothetical protein [Nonomuraea sp. NPDC050783]|uniref:hypothetical protein n=1 Tax=Nonomuraea sp. NPDC050783 TaxID=3154634 RepID=UPI003466AA5C
MLLQEPLEALSGLLPYGGLTGPASPVSLVQDASGTPERPRAESDDTVVHSGNRAVIGGRPLRAGTVLDGRPLRGGATLDGRPLKGGTALDGRPLKGGTALDGRPLKGGTVLDGHALRSRAAVQALRSPIRTGVVRMPRFRPPIVHSRARVLGVHARVDLTRVLPRQAAMRVSHVTADGWLRNAGLRTRSTGHCTSKRQHHCTSLDKVRTGTVARIIQLKRDSHCPIMVTGGTEEGHAPGRYSHGNGYKLDISHNTCIDRYITRNHRKAGVRGDGSRLYRSASGTTFADEVDHWDILFR